jgi:hypothetical protein
MLIECEYARKNYDTGEYQKHLIRREVWPNIEWIPNANQTVRTHCNHTEERAGAHPVCEADNVKFNVEIEPSEVVVESQEWIVYEYVRYQESQKANVANSQ